jgi:HlyD family secretion protein
VKKGIIISAIVVLVIGLPILKQSLGGAKTVEVEIEKLEKRAIRSSTLASGTLTHENRALISTEIIGRVAEVLVEEGEAVDEGQLLLRIDDTPYLSEVEQFTALEKIQSIEVKRHQLRVENLDKNWKRQKKLHRDGLLDDTSFENATHSVDLARIDLQTAEESLVQSRARLAQAQDRLNKTRIRSPFKGIVTSVDIKPGEMAIASSTNIPGSSLMTVADPLSIHTEVNVDEADIANIRIGQEAEVVAVAYPDQPIKGIVEAVASTARIPPGRQSLSFAVKIRFEEPELLELKPGMSCRAEIFTHNAEAMLAVPVQAIQSSHEGSDNESFYIYVEENLKAKKVEVETGIADDDYQAIEAEISEGQNIIIGPDRTLRNLTDGDSIEYKES